MGEVTWHDRCAPPPGKAFHCNAPKHIFEEHFILYPSPNFFNIVNASGIDIHLKFTYPYHFYLNETLLDGYLSLHIDLSVTYFCLVIFEEDASVVKYMSCKLCIFLSSTGKHYACSAQKSDIVWCEIFRSYFYFNRYCYQNPNVVLQFLFYIKLYKDNYTQIQIVLFIQYSFTFISLSIAIFIPCICYY